MNHYSVHDTLYEENGNFRLTKEECGILLKKKKSSVVYCPKEDERRPGAMYPRCICLAHNGEKTAPCLQPLNATAMEHRFFPSTKVMMMGRAGTGCLKSGMRKKALAAASSRIFWSCR